MTILDILLPPDDLECMSRRERKKQETRWRIYEAGIDLMSQYGFDEVTIEEICDAADVSTPLFFHHFSSKSALVGAYLENLKDSITEKLARAPDASPTQQIHIINKEVVRAAKESAPFTSQLFYAIVSREKEQGPKNVDVSHTAMLSDIVKRGQANGEFHKDWDPDVAAFSITGAWLCLPFAAGSATFPKRSHADILQVVLAGLRAPPGNT